MPKHANNKNKHSDGVSCSTYNAFIIYVVIVFGLRGKLCITNVSESESELLLVTRSNDNHSPGPVMREVSP